jgi:hypothetical protein
MVKYIDNTDLIYCVKDYDVILVGTTINNSLGNGFQKDVARSFRYVELANRRTVYGDKKKLGTVLVVKGEPTFCLCYIYEARTNPSTRPDVLNYDALFQCLCQIDQKFQDKRIATTLIGASKFDGGGDENKVREMLEAAFVNSDVDVYTYEQKNFKEVDAERFNRIVTLRNEGKITREEYESLKKLDLWLRNRGIYEEMPRDMSYIELKDFLNRHKENEED